MECFCVSGVCGSRTLGGVVLRLLFVGLGWSDMLSFVFVGLGWSEMLSFVHVCLGWRDMLSCIMLPMFE